MTQRTWWLCYWLAWILWALAAIIVSSKAKAEDCYTPLTCLYGNNLGRSMEYDRQQRQMQDLQSRQREMELQQREERNRREEINRELERRLHNYGRDSRW